MAGTKSSKSSTNLGISYFLRLSSLDLDKRDNKMDERNGVPSIEIGIHFTNEIF